MSFIVIGIDGGGSKTHPIVADEHGTTLNETMGPGSAVHPGHADVADSGDLRASALVSLAAEELALHVRSLAHQLFAGERAALPSRSREACCSAAARSASDSSTGCAPRVK